ncbi:oligosaccharide flippase family protein [Aetokthonos hydrillicola Thurmond2011]|jgi:O-antigen/teichoic acid export membrane protein|uniref:Oligosaccharide flippase family protein n=1 Tax=Aetokthonos hydrillicola Thurmond2011 TaxID=2712845 RepID=A0AAP5I620_9CYAN|nr:oligosaccharide flippase family protein [Aetokthonos hydrillicola]MBO3459252.1 oligosaccharide flippase family protein [Aetokthonos hydrillicola CCALA 1050]MBW4584914.1 oligosaccharide flippase family protein [Aetokthonos hydrillicola CCALA 1050]MDR9894327.1 oligosaccharide flippase family protein [Aetokthonos hydrillicola Thurmond2011]
MSTAKRIAFAVAASWFSRATTILANLFFMPILFRHMGKEELGLWLLLGNSQAFLGLLGIGVAPILMRDIALAKGRSGADPGVTLTTETKQHIGDLVVTGRTILQWLSIIVFFIAWISGYGFIQQLELKNVAPHIVFWSWTLMCAGYAVGIWISYLDCLLAGMGYIGWDSLLGTALSFLTILINIAAVVCGGGLLELAAISVVASLCQRFVILGFIRWRKPELFEIQGRWSTEYAKALIKPSFYYWLTNLGSFLILRTDAYFIGILKGTQNIPIYQAGYQLVSNLYQLAVSFGAASAVFIGQAWQAKELGIVQKITIRNSQLGMSIMAAGVGFLLGVCKELMDLWLGEGNFIGYDFILVFCIMLTLEAQQVILIYSSRATDDENYASWTLMAGFLNVVLTLVFYKYFGLLGVALGTMFAQMLTNNWYGVYRPIMRLKLSFKNYLNRVLLLWVVILVLCLSITNLIKYTLILLSLNSNWLIVGLSAASCGTIFLIFIWLYILENNQQQYFLYQLRLIKNNIFFTK